MTTYYIQVVNCEHEEVGDNVFKLKYAKSRRQKGQRSLLTTPPGLFTNFVFLGKRVFKKPVKFLIKVVPTETAVESGESDHGDSRTYIVTFVQISGELQWLLWRQEMHV